MIIYNFINFFFKIVNSKVIAVSNLLEILEEKLAYIKLSKK